MIAPQRFTIISRVMIFVLLILLAEQTLVLSQGPPRPDPLDAMEQPRRRFETYGRFGVRTYASPAEIEQSPMFPNSGMRDPNTGRYRYREELESSRLFPLALTPQEAAALRAQRGGDRGLPVLIPEGRPIADVQPYAASDLPPATVTGHTGGIQSETPWRPYPTGEEVPFRNDGMGQHDHTAQEQIGTGEEVWMRGGGAPRAESGLQPSRPDFGPINNGTGTGPRVPMAGPGQSTRTGVTSPAPSLQTDQLARDQQTALRLARKVVYTPGVNAVSAITVTFRNGTAMIQGAVASQQGRNLAEQILSSDADVRVVQNLLSVFEGRSGPASTPSGTTPNTPAPPQVPVEPVPDVPTPLPSPGPAEETTPVEPTS
jgi:hypothetical protein